MERAKQLGKIDARCILEPAGNLIDHAGRVTYELRGVAIAIHLNGVEQGGEPSGHFPKVL